MVTTKVLTPLEVFTKHRDEAEFAKVRSADEIRAAAAAAAAALEQRQRDFTDEVMLDPPSRAALAAADVELGVAVVAALKVHAGKFDEHNDRIRDLSGMCRLVELVDLPDQPVMFRTSGIERGLQISGRVVHRGERLDDQSAARLQLGCLHRQGDDPMTDLDRDIAAAAVELALTAAQDGTLTPQTRPTSKRDLRSPEEKAADDAIVDAAVLRLRLS